MSFPLLKPSSKEKNNKNAYESEVSLFRINNENPKEISFY